MHAFFQSVAEAFACKGFHALSKEIPFGNFLYEVAADAWKRLREKKKEREAREEVAKMARAAADEVRHAAEEAARAALPHDPAKALELAAYPAQIPATVRRTLRRPDDPTGTTVPLAFALDRTEQLLALLPARVSAFRPGDPLPGRDGWHLTELLGTGGFGEVWRAKQPRFASLDRAVKFCTGLTDRERALLHEGAVIDRVMAAGPVPNVVALIDAHLTGEAPWLMYEFVPGGDLVGLVDAWRALPPAARHAAALAALRQILAAVAHFHKLGVVHRDLKPANVLLSGDALKVTDFGIGGVAARRELEAGAGARTSTAERIASLARGAFTPVYASPQQKRGDPPDPRDDVYALGVVAYQMLVGDVAAERPGGKGWRRELETQGVRPAALDVLESCWDDDPNERPADAGELLARLSAAGPASPVPAAPRPAPDRDEKSGSPAGPAEAAGRARAEPRPVPGGRRVVQLRVVAVLIALGLLVGGGFAVTAVVRNYFAPNPAAEQIVGEWRTSQSGQGWFFRPDGTFSQVVELGTGMGTKSEQKTGSGRYSIARDGKIELRFEGLMSQRKVKQVEFDGQHQMRIKGEGDPDWESYTRVGYGTWK